MTEVRVTKKDVIWSYVAQFFNLGIGFITLPAILKMLNADEVGLNYILVSINSVISLFDMGFSSQFGKNITYVLSGAQTIEKEGVSVSYNESINEKLLSSILSTAKSIYKKLSFIAMIPLLTFGTYYVWTITNNGTSVDNLILIWSIFCISCFFNLYFLYFNSFLQGRGFIKEAKQGQILSRIIQIIIMLTMLICGCGLISVVVANLIAPFAFRYYANYKFSDNYINEIQKKYQATSEDINKLFHILLYNAKKVGIIGILAAVLGYASTLVVGAFLSLAEVGSYGVMIQLLGIIGGMSTILFYSLTPEMSKLIVKNQLPELREKFGLSLFVFIILQLLGLIIMIIAPMFFKIFGFNTKLPSLTIIIFFCIYKFIELYQSLFSQLLLIGNDLIFYKSAILTGISSITLQFVFLYLGYGFWGILFAYLIPLCAYSAWKWPLFTSKKYDINLERDIIQNSFHLINKYYARHFKN